MKLDGKTIWKIILISVGAPIILNVLMWIPSFGLAATNTEGWLSFFGNYSGGIIGGIVAYIIAKSQIEHEKGERLLEEKEKEKFALNIVETFLYAELKINLDSIPNTVITALEEQSKGNLRGSYVWGNKQFTLDVYEEIKFELIKYNNVFVRDTVELYKLLKRFERVYEINKISRPHAKEYYVKFSSWKTRLDI